MKKYNLSSFISGFLFLKIIYLKKAFKKLYHENKFLFLFLKLGSVNLKKSLYFKTKIIWITLTPKQVGLKYIKLLLGYCDFKKASTLIYKFSGWESNFFFKKRFTDLFELFFQFHRHSLKRVEILSSVTLNSCLKVNIRVKKISSLRVILSGITSNIKKNISNSLSGLIMFFLENPLISSKRSIQEIIWNKFRIKTIIKKIYRLCLEVRSFLYLNNSRFSQFFFSFISKYLDIIYLLPFINFCFKNFHKFINEKTGQFLLLRILNDLCKKKKLWLNFKFFKKIFNFKTISFDCTEIFFRFFLRKTTRFFRKNSVYKHISGLKRKINKNSLINQLINKKKLYLVFFVSFIYLKIFKDNLDSYPSILHDEFFRSIKTIKKHTTDEIGIIKKSVISKINLTYGFVFQKRRKCLLIFTMKIKYFIPVIQSIFYLVKKILKYFIEFLKRKNSFVRNFYCLFSQPLIRHVYLNLSFIETLKLHIRVSDCVLIKLHKLHILYENR